MAEPKFKVGDLVTIGAKSFNVYTVTRDSGSGFLAVNCHRYTHDGRHVHGMLSDLQHYDASGSQPSTPPGFAQQQVSGGTKHDTGKHPWHLISVQAIDEMLLVLEFGSRKYAAHNWRKGFEWTRLVSAASRHLFAFLRGEDRDPETGLLHTAHLMCCAMFLTEHVLLKRGTDDRYKEAL